MSYSIDSQVFFRIFTFYISFGDLFLNWLNWVHMYKYTKINALNLREISSLPKSKNLISIITENKLHAHHKTHLHTMKVLQQPTTKVCSLRLFFFYHWSIHLFQSNQSFQAIEFVDRPVRKSLTSLTLIFPKLSSQNIHGTLENFCILLVTLQYSHPQFPRSPLGMPGIVIPPFWLAQTHTKKKRSACIFRVSLLKHAWLKNKTC